MDPQPPPASWVQQDNAEELQLEENFAQVLFSLMKDDITAADAIKMFEQASVSMMQQHREVSSSLLHRAARYLHTRRLASELEDQAASWQLLQSLYCSNDAPAGVDIPGAADVGSRRTLWQQTADLINNRDSQLRRCAQVVSWLEERSAQQLSDAPTSRFAQHEGLWRETLLTSAGGNDSSTWLAGRSSSSSADHSAALSLELDPDAPSRDKVRLALGDRQGEERLAAQLWQLIRAGKVKEARQLCVQAGQAWRCVSLAGGGPWGPLPVGAAAVATTDVVDAQDAADELAWQVEGGAAAARVTWKWACYAAAEAAANATPGNRWEAAVYGSLCGHLSRVLPVCSNWEDEAWAYCRAWLELKSDHLLLQGVEDPEDEEVVRFDLNGALSPDLMMDSSAEGMVSADLLAGCVALGASSGYSNNCDTSLLREGLNVLAGDWPPRRLLAGAARIPKDFEDLTQLLHSSNNPAVRNASAQLQHTLQLEIICERWSTLTSALAASVLKAQDQLAQHQQQGGRANTLSGDEGTGDGDAAMEDEGASGLAPGEDEGTQESAEIATSVLRFNAHLALALRALGLLYPHEWVEGEEEQKEAGRVQTMLDKVIYGYAVQLAQQRDWLPIVPLYICHLKQTQREGLLRQLISSATDLLDDDSCQELYLQLVTATEDWWARQQRLQAAVLKGHTPGPWWHLAQEEDEEPQDAAGGGEGGLWEAQRMPSNCLFGDLRADEMTSLLVHLATDAFSSSRTSSLERCRLLRWLFYSFTGALAQQQHQLQQLQGLEAAAARDSAVPAMLGWQRAWKEALDGSLKMAAELALNPGFGSSGLQVLLCDVVPPEFLHVASQVAAEQLGDASLLLQVQRKLLVLSFWQRYVELDGQYQQWRSERLALVAKGDTAGLAQSAAAGEQLVRNMLQLAQEDLLSLPAPAALVQLLRQQAAAAGAARGEGSLDVQLAEGESLADPRHDSSSESPGRLVLVVSVARSSTGGSKADVEAGIGFSPDADLPFVQMEAREQQQLQEQLADYLHAATLHLPDVEYRTSVPDSDNGSDNDCTGCLSITLGFKEDLRTMVTGLSGSAPEADKARLKRRALKAWHNVVAVASQLLTGSGRQLIGGEQDSGSLASKLPTMPRLTVVTMNGSLSTIVGLCRRRSTSKLLRRSAKVLLELAALGHCSEQLDALIDVAADGGAGDGAAMERQQLLPLLTPRDAAQLLVVIEEILQQTGGVL